MGTIKLLVREREIPAMNDAKPFSQACENNKQPILDHLKPLLQECQHVLEIGSGTGQHAVYFAANMPQIVWQCSDRSENIPGIKSWLADTSLAPPLTLDVRDSNWPTQQYDAIFSANTLHIMSWAEVELFFAKVNTHLKPTALLCIYGPFKYHGEFTSPSNADFELWLKGNDPLSGIRDFEAVNLLAQQAGLNLFADHRMPANNQLLVWQRLG
jgi:cyclopropane fatty-acyl-phospholipid synthase-like methyltransferase